MTVAHDDLGDGPSPAVRGNSGKIGSVIPGLTRTLLPIWKRELIDPFFFWLMAHSSCDSIV